MFNIGVGNRRIVKLSRKTLANEQLNSQTGSCLPTLNPDNLLRHPRLEIKSVLIDLMMHQFTVKQKTKVCEFKNGERDIQLTSSQFVFFSKTGKFLLQVQLLSKHNLVFHICMDLSQIANCDFKGLTQLSFWLVDTGMLRVTKGGHFSCIPHPNLIDSVFVLLLHIVDTQMWHISIYLNLAPLILTLWKQKAMKWN